jgi:hypothetical protein
MEFTKKRDMKAWPTESEAKRIREEREARQQSRQKLKVGKTPPPLSGGK